MKEIKIFEQAMHKDNEFFRTHQLNLIGSIKDIERNQDF